MKFRIFIAAALVFCFIGCETVQESPRQEPVLSETETIEQDESSLNRYEEKQAELDLLEEELNAELANLRVRENDVEQKEAMLDSLFTELEQREKIAEMEIARAGQLRATGGWMLFIGIILIVLALYLTFKPKNKVNPEPSVKEPETVVEQPQAEPEQTETADEPEAEPKPIAANDIKEKELPKEKPEESEPQLQDTEEKDDLYEQAKKLVVENNKAAISFLQSELKIGRGRIMKILDELEKEGIVGPAEPGKSRKVL